jgi:hypothetical protein
MSAPTQQSGVFNLHLTVTECAELESILEHVIAELEEIGEDQIGSEGEVVQSLLHKLRLAQS